MSRPIPSMLKLETRSKASVGSTAPAAEEESTGILKLIIAAGVGFLGGYLYRTGEVESLKQSLQTHRAMEEYRKLPLPSVARPLASTGPAPTMSLQHVSLATPDADEDVEESAPAIDEDLPPKAS